MTKKSAKLEFVHQIDSVHKIFQDHLNVAEIYPHKENMDIVLKNLNSAKLKINSFIASNYKGQFEPEIEINIGVRKYSINMKDAPGWIDLITHKEKNFLQLAHVYNTLEEKIVENIQLENIKPYSKESGIIYLNHVTMFIPLSKIEKCSIREQLKRVDYLMGKSTSTYSIHNNIYDRDEALQFAQNATQNCFYVLNASEYPLKETAVPLIGEKYKKIRKEITELNSGPGFGPAVH